MKRIILPLAVFALVVSCNKKTETKLLHQQIHLLPKRNLALQLQLQLQKLRQKFRNFLMKM